MPEAPVLTSAATQLLLPLFLHFGLSPASMRP